MKNFSPFISILILLFTSQSFFAQEIGELTVEKIMRDPEWIGTSPSNVRWSDDGEYYYFRWNPDNEDEKSLYKIKVGTTDILKVSEEEEENLPSPYGSLNKDKTKKLYTKDGDIYLLNIKNGEKKRITNTVERESNPKFLNDESIVAFIKSTNLYLFDTGSGTINQLTNFKKGKKKKPDKKQLSDQEQWVKDRQLELIDVLYERKKKRDADKKEREADQQKHTAEIYYGNSSVQSIQISPDGNFITFRLVDYPKGNKRAIIPHYVTEDGYTDSKEAYSKVGAKQAFYKFGIYNVRADSVYYVSVQNLEGIFDFPRYLSEYKLPKSFIDSSKAREVSINGPVWSENGEKAVVVIRSLDNKDRWICLLNAETGSVELLDRQRDEAWIAGPGIYGWKGSTGNIGWLKDGKTLWFQSEETGYSHLYTIDVKTGEKKQLTDGEFEVYNPQISADEKFWYFTSNEVHPGVRHFYRMPIEGGLRSKYISKVGNNRIYLSPDEENIVILYSYSNKPVELLFQKNSLDAIPAQITESVSEEFLSYPWRDPEVITFEAEDGTEVYARLYNPEDANKNNAAVIFVHGAGYLQNAHKWRCSISFARCLILQT